MVYRLWLNSKLCRGKSTQYTYKSLLWPIIWIYQPAEQGHVKCQMCFTLTFHLRFIFGYNLLVFSEFRRRRHDGLENAEHWKGATEANTTTTTVRLFPPSLCVITISNRLLGVRYSGKGGENDYCFISKLELPAWWAAYALSFRRALLQVRLRKPGEERSRLAFPLDDTRRWCDPKVSLVGFVQAEEDLRTRLSAAHALLKAESWGCIRKPAGLGLNTALFWAGHWNL